MNTHAQSEQPQRTIRLDQIISRAMLHYNAVKLRRDFLPVGCDQIPNQDIAGNNDPTHNVDVCNFVHTRLCRTSLNVRGVPGRLWT